jgi:hypothetical protein
LDLYRLFEKSYLTMLRTPFGRDAMEHSQFLAQCRHNSLFVWLEKGLQKVYGFDEKLTAENWDALSKLVEDKHSRLDVCTTILKENAGYQRAIQDAYWDYSSDNGHPKYYRHLRICSSVSITRTSPITTAILPLEVIRTFRPVILRTTWDMWRLSLPAGVNEAPWL